MVTHKFYKRLAALFTVFCIALFLLIQNTPAAGVDEAIYGSITLTCRTETVTLVGMKWDIYRVASRNPARSYNTYSTEGQFYGTPVMLNDLDNYGFTNAAVTLENEAVLKKYTPDATAYTDASGVICFDSLTPGLYLLSGKRMTLGDTTYIPTAMLIEIMADEEHENLEINALPKLQWRTLAGTESRYTVKKIWQQDTGYETDRSFSITVNVYQDGELYDTAVLNASNNWEMTWYANSDVEWRVEEVDIPKKYTVIYRSNESQYVIENSYNPNYNSSWSGEDKWEETTTPAETTTTEMTTKTTDDQFTDLETTTDDVGRDTDISTPASTNKVNTTATTTTTTTTTTVTTAPGGGSGGGNGSTPSGGGGGGNGGGGGKLPQTGQLWWPVPLLALGGIVFMMVGWQLRREED